MLKSYFKIGWRNLMRNNVFSIINLLGLAMGMAVFLFIMQYVASEWNANRYNKNYSHLYRVNIEHKEGRVDYDVAAGAVPAIGQKVPGAETFVRVSDGIAAGVLTATSATGNDNVFRCDDMLYADGNFLKVFSFPVVTGSTLLTQPNTLAISETISKKLFGKEEAVGKTITVSNQFGNTPYTVSTVYKQPANSDIKAEVILTLNTLENPANRDGNDWADPNGMESSFVTAYLLLSKTVNSQTVALNINNFIHSINPAAAGETVVLQPFSSLHLAPSFSYPYQTYGSLLLVAVFFCVAVLILLIAWVNYINLSTAQATNRAKDVGVRKVLGATRSQLVFQYLAETLLLTTASVVVAMVLVLLLQPYFNLFTGKTLSVMVLNNGWFWFGVVVLILVGSFLSGSYVAFVLTAYKPINTVKGKVVNVTKGFSFRKALVVFQFTTSIVFIIATIILYNQLQFMKTEKLGMNLNQLLVIQGPTVSSEQQAQKNVAFKNGLAQLPFVKKYAASNNIPGVGYNFSTSGITRLTPQNNDDKKGYSMFICDERFFDTYEIQFAQGQTFTTNDAERSWNNVRKVIINESAARQLGFDIKQNIVGQKVLWGEPFEVIGVVKDYHHLSLREAIVPTIYLGSVSFSFFTIQTDLANMPVKIATIKTMFTNAFPGNPFEYFFADDRYDQQYIAEQKLGNVFIAAALIAMLIACMGLYGLATFSARQRIKEIGIRKVLGASVASITKLLSIDFIVPVLIAIVIASPIAWWAMQSWLQNFAYQTTITWWIFIAAGSLAITIALGTISIQAMKAAIANPVKSLRTE